MYTPNLSHIIIKISAKDNCVTKTKQNSHYSFINTKYKHLFDTVAVGTTHYGHQKLV